MNIWPWICGDINAQMKQGYEDGQRDKREGKGYKDGDQITPYNQGYHAGYKSLPFPKLKKS